MLSNALSLLKDVVKVLNLLMQNCCKNKKLKSWEINSAEDTKIKKNCKGFCIFDYFPAKLIL